MAGVDLEAGDQAGHAEPDHAPVVPGHALAAALPAVHPLAVLVIFAGDEDRLRRIDQPFLVGEEIVGRMDHLGAKPGLGEIDIVAAKLVEHVYPDWAGWVARQWRAISMRRQNQTS